MTGHFRLAHSGHVAAHAERGGRHIKIMLHGEAFGPREGNRGLEHHVPAVEGYFGEGTHVVNVVEEVEAADDLVIVADHFSRQPHEIFRLRAVAEHVGGADEDLLERFRGELVPLEGFGEGVGHVGHHGHMEVRPPAVFQREETAVVKIGPDEPIFGQPEAVAAVGLRAVAGGRVREVDAAAVAHVVEERQPVAARIGGRLLARLGRDGRQDDFLTGQARRGVGAVLPKLHMGVVALGRDFRDELGEAFAFRREVGVDHELRRGGDEARIEHARTEGRVLDDLTEEGDGGLHAADHVFGQGAFHDPEHLLPVAAVGDEQGARRVVVRRELVTGGEVGVDTHAGAAGRDVTGDQAGVGGEAVLRVLAVDAHLHGHVRGLGVLFGEAQLRAEGDGDLLFHEVDPVTAFGDAVFHLKAGVDFDEVGLALRRNQKFDGGEGVVAHFAHEHARVLLQTLAQFGRDAGPRRRGDFHELLVVALHGAVAFVEGENVAVLVRDDLNLDVTHGFEVFFHVEARVAEGGLRHGRGLKKGIFQFTFLPNKENAASAAAAFGLEHDGKRDLVHDLTGRGYVHSAFGAGNHGDTQPFGDLADLHLVAEQVHGFGLRADEGDARLFALLRETLVFGGEAPAGMDGDDAALLGLGDDQIKVEIGAGVLPEKKQLLS